MTNGTDELSSIVDIELSGVAFIRDYIEFMFDGPILRVNGILNIYVEGRQIQRGDADFLSSLIDLIGATVLGAQSTNESIKIKLDGDRSFEALADPLVVEYAVFLTYPERKMIVWQGSIEEAGR